MQLTQAILGVFTGLVSTLSTDPVPVQPFASADSAYYLQINLQQMRDSSAGSGLYAWIEDEILEEIGDEFEIDISNKLDAISVFGAGAEQHPVVLLQGNLGGEFRQAAGDLLLEHNESAERLSKHGREYFRLGVNDFESKDGNVDIDLGEIDTLYFAVGDQQQTLITADPDMLDEFLLAGELLLPPATRESSQLLVLQASRPLLQGGLNTRHGAFDDGPWQSSMFKNVDQFGLVIAELDNALEFRAEAVTRTEGMAGALANIVQGVIGLKALANQGSDDASGNHDLDWLNSLDVSSQQNVTRIRVQFTADQLERLLD